MRRIILSSPFSMILLLLVFCIKPVHALPQVITVTKTADSSDGYCDGDCSLREAIAWAYETASEDYWATIYLSPGVYTLSVTGDEGTPENNSANNAVGDLDVLGFVEIIGTDAATTIIDGGGLSRVFQVGSDSIRAGLSLEKITVRNGNAENNGQGGGVYLLNGIVEIDNSIITHNTAYGGGGVHNDINGMMYILNSTITENASTNHFGGIHNYDGWMTITDSTISNNTAIEAAGVMNNEGGYLTIERSTITGNVAKQNGGGLSNSNYSSVFVNNTTISGNRAGDNPNTGGYGGGIYNGSGNVFINNSTVTYNEAPIGTNGNPTGRGAGIYALAEVTIRNSIVAGNSGEADVNCGGDYLTSEGYNLFGQNEGENDCPVFGTGNILLTGSITTVFSALADNGGATQTHKLITGSPALNTGECNRASGVDQRNLPRPAGSACDMGAVELQASEGSGTAGGVCPVNPGINPLSRAPVRPEIFELQNSAYPPLREEAILTPAVGTKIDIVVWNAASNQILLETSVYCALCYLMPDVTNMPTGLLNGDNQVWIRWYDSLMNETPNEWQLRASVQLNFAAPATPTGMTVTGNQGRPSIQIPEDNAAAWYQVWIGGEDYEHLQWYEKKLHQCCDGICTIHLDAYPPEGSYEVYAQAWGPGGYSSGGQFNGWAGPKPLTIALTQPELVIPLTATLDVYQGTLNWQGTAGAEWYEVWVGSSDYTHTMHLEWHSAADLHCQNATLCSLTSPLYAWDMTVGESYTWFVRAWGTEGFSTGGDYDGWAKGEDIIITDPYD